MGPPISRALLSPTSECCIAWSKDERVSGCRVGDWGKTWVEGKGKGEIWKVWLRQIDDKIILGSQAEEKKWWEGFGVMGEEGEVDDEHCRAVAFVVISVFFFLSFEWVAWDPLTSKNILETPHMLTTSCPCYLTICPMLRLDGDGGGDLFLAFQQMCKKGVGFAWGMEGEGGRKRVESAGGYHTMSHPVCGAE